jgi:hypothetical protein
MRVLVEERGRGSPSLCAGAVPDVARSGLALRPEENLRGANGTGGLQMEMEIRAGV